MQCIYKLEKCAVVSACRPTPLAHPNANQFSDLRVGHFPRAGYAMLLGGSQYAPILLGSAPGLMSVEMAILALLDKQCLTGITSTPLETAGMPETEITRSEPNGMVTLALTSVTSTLLVTAA